MTEETSEAEEASIPLVTFRLRHSSIPATYRYSVQLPIQRLLKILQDSSPAAAAASSQSAKDHAWESDYFATKLQPCFIRLTFCDCAAYWVSFGHRFAAEFPPNSGRTLASRDSLLIIMTMTASSRRLTFGTKVGLRFPYHVLPSKYPSGVPLRVRDLLAPLKSSPTDKDSSTSSSLTSSEPPTSTFEAPLLVVILIECAFDALGVPCTRCTDSVVVDCRESGPALDSESLLSESRDHTPTTSFSVDTSAGYPTFEPQSDCKDVPRKSFLVTRDQVCSDPEHTVKVYGFLGAGEGVSSITTEILASNRLASKSIAFSEPSKRVSLLLVFVAWLMSSFLVAHGKIDTDLECVPTTHKSDVFEAGEGNYSSLTVYKIKFLNRGAPSEYLFASDGVFLAPSLHRRDSTASAGIDRKLLSSAPILLALLVYYRDIHPDPVPSNAMDLRDCLSEGQSDLPALDTPYECGSTTSLEAPGFDFVPTDSALVATTTISFITSFDSCVESAEQEPFGVTPLVAKVADSCLVDPVGLGSDFCYARLM